MTAFSRTNDPLSSEKNQSINVLFYVCSHRGDIRQNLRRSRPRWHHLAWTHQLRSICLRGPQEQRGHAATPAADSLSHIPSSVQPLAHPCPHCYKIFTARICLVSHLHTLRPQHHLAKVLLVFDRQRRTSRFFFFSSSSFFFFFFFFCSFPPPPPPPSSSSSSSSSSACFYCCREVCRFCAFILIRTRIMTDIMNKTTIKSKDS